MWKVVYIAQNKAETERLQKKLTEEGFLIKVKPLGSNADGGASSCEILVLASEVDEAMEVINSF
nr:hypothetical protein [Desulfofalx alkaliphila]